MKTLFGKLFLSFILIIVLIIASVLAAFTLVYSNSYEDQVVKENTQKAEYVALSLYSFLNLAYKLVEGLSYNAEVLSMDTEKQTSIFIDTVERNKFFELLYAQGIDGMQTGRSAGELGSRRERPWFIKMLETKKPFISETYVSISTDTVVASIYFPMLNGNEMTGIMGADISLFSLHDLVMRFNDEYSHSFIMDGKGVVVAHPDRTFLDELYNYSTFTKTVLMRDEYGNAVKNSAGHDTEQIPINISDEYKAPIQSMMNGNSGWTKFREDGKLLYMNYLPVHLDGYSDPWYVITIRDGEHAMQTRNTVILIILASAVFISLITLLIVYFVSRNISSPIKKVHSILQRIKDGDLTNEITVKSRDEIGEMMEILSQTQDSIKSLINNIKVEAAARLRASEESKSKTSFLAKMSHEIRTPMNAIIGMTEMLLRGDLSDTARSHIHDIKLAGNNLLSIINDILDFSKIEAGRIEIINKNYLLSALINDTVNIIRMRLAEKPLQFKVFIDGSIPNSLIGDEDRFRQILLNLLSNAVKYTDNGQISLSVMMIKRDNKQVLLSAEISDTGKGIRYEDQKKLFNDFTRLDQKQNQGIEGTGLGLAIAKRLSNAMGGDISVKSQFGKGSTFTLRIPQIVESEEPISMAKEHVDNSNASEPEDLFLINFIIPDARLLIVDDSLTNLKVAEGLMSPYKAAVDTCASGEEAIRLVEQNDYDLVFMDHMMPEMDGIETAARIRSMENNGQLSGKTKKNLPIIALTANAIAGMREMFLENGFNDFLSKPVDVIKLNEIFDRWIPQEMKKTVSYEHDKPVKSSNEDAKGLPLLNTDSALFNISDLDVKNGLILTNSTVECYCTLLSLFCKDTEKRLPLLKNAPSADGMSLFTTNVHAIKSAAAFIGANELSKKAFKLEEAGNAGDINFIKDNLNDFLDMMEKFLNNVHTALDADV